MFSALDNDDREKMARLLEAVHAQFIDAVIASRGERLTGTPEVVFSGDLWVGEEAVTLGLVDELCTLGHALDELGAAHTRDYTPRRSLLERVSDELAIRAAAMLALGAAPRPMYMP